jgi:hypothetical protein
LIENEFVQDMDWPVTAFTEIATIERHGDGNTITEFTFIATAALSFKAQFAARHQQ